jgi:hypothetical protein
MIKKLNMDTKLRADDTIPATLTEAIAPTEQEPPVPVKDAGDTVFDQNEDNAAGGYGSHLNGAESRMIPLEQIKLSDDYQFRVKEDGGTIEDYADIFRQYRDDLAAGQSATYPFPAIVVLRENDDVYYVVSGRHRFQAATKAGIKEMACIVLTDRIEAIQEGLKSNRQHGLRLNKEDKALCIKLAINELDWSNRRIADLVGCSRQYVDKIKKEQPNLQNTVKGKDGKEYPAGGVCKTRANKAGLLPEITPEIAPPTTPSNQNDLTIDALKAAFDLNVDCPKRSDALLDVFTMIAANGFGNNKVRREYLQNVLRVCSEYGVFPIETHSGDKDAA